MQRQKKTALTSPQAPGLVRLFAFYSRDSQKGFNALLDRKRCRSQSGRLRLNRVRMGSMATPQFFFTICKAQTDKFLGFLFNAFQRHMITCLSCHLQTPQGLEQAAYGVHTKMFCRFYSSVDREIRPRGSRPILPPWDAVHKRHQVHTPCGMLM